jgi:hypothetical protein
MKRTEEIETTRASTATQFPPHALNWLFKNWLEIQGLVLFQNYGPHAFPMLQENKQLVYSGVQHISLYQ